MSRNHRIQEIMDMLNNAWSFRYSQKYVHHIAVQRYAIEVQTGEPFMWYD